MVKQTNMIIGIVVIIVIIAALLFFTSGANTTSSTSTIVQPTTTLQSPTTTVTSTPPITTVSPTTTVLQTQGMQTFVINETEWSFSPNSITLANGTTVYFEVHNQGRYQHSFTLETTGLMIDSGYIAPGGNTTVLYDFTAPGNYTYYSRVPNDSLHNLKGTLVVK